MASAEAAGDSAAPDSSKNQFLFWGCFAALIATAFGFQVRAMLMLTWATSLDSVRPNKAKFSEPACGRLLSASFS
jgi:hypothetical protein